ncbi:unnamed protein product, partial [Brenthis ino]
MLLRLEDNALKKLERQPRYKQTGQALILPGIAVTYQGEEIGMTDGYVSWEDTRDPQGCNTDDPINYYKKSRDPSRTPYHWDNSSNAGFSATQGKTWLPVADNYKNLYLADQINTPKSHYHFYKDVAAIRLQQCNMGTWMSELFQNLF